MQPPGPPTVPEGWQPCAMQEGFSSVAGPYMERRDGDSWQRAFIVTERHLNPEGVVHGGVLASFADYAGYRAIGDVLGHGVRFATLTLTCNYLAAGKPGSLIVGQGRITRRTRSVVFCDGTVEDAERLLLTFSGVWKIIGA